MKRALEEREENTSAKLSARILKEVSSLQQQLAEEQ